MEQAAPPTWEAFQNSKSWCAVCVASTGDHLRYLTRADGQMRRFRSEDGALAAIRRELRSAPVPTRPPG